MSQGPLCPNLTQKVQKEVSQIANRNLPHVILLGGLSVNLNHLKKWEKIRQGQKMLNFEASKLGVRRGARPPPPRIR